MAQQCYVGMGQTPEELKKAKANLASMKSKNKKAMAPLIDEIVALDPTGNGLVAQKALKDLELDFVTPQIYKKTITDLHAKTQLNQAQTAVVTAQADVDAAKFQLAKAKDLDAKAKANLASQKSKAKKKAEDLIDALQASGYEDEAIELAASIDSMVNGNTLPADLVAHIGILKNLPATPPPITIVPPAVIAPHTPPVKDWSGIPAAHKNDEFFPTTEVFDGFKPGVDVYSGEAYIGAGGPLEFLHQVGAPTFKGGPNAGYAQWMDWDNGVDTYITTLNPQTTKFFSAQPNLTTSQVGLYQLTSPNPPIDAFKWNNEIWVVDGNHRLAAARINGETAIDVNLFDIDAVLKIEGVPPKKLWPTELPTTPPAQVLPPITVPATGPLQGADITAAFKANNQKFTDKYTLEAIKQYSDESAVINEMLRYGEIRHSEYIFTDNMDMDRLPEFVNLLDDAMAKSTVPGDMVVYRGVNSFDPGKTLKPGDAFVDRGYVSTSNNLESAETYGAGTEAVIFTINVPAGTNAIDFSSQTPGTIWGEVLLDRHQSFIVNSVDEIAGVRHMNVSVIETPAKFAKDEIFDAGNFNPLKSKKDFDVFTPPVTAPSTGPFSGTINPATTPTEQAFIRENPSPLYDHHIVPGVSAGDPPIAWQPTMTPADAAVWASTSAVPTQSVFHFTNPQSMASIKQGGFKPGPMSQVDEPAIYFTSMPDAGGTSAGSAKEMLRAAIHTKNPYIHDSINGIKNVPSIKDLKALGHDAVIFRKSKLEMPLSDGSGSSDDWIVAFDKEQVVIIDDAAPAIVNPAITAPPAVAAPPTIKLTGDQIKADIQSWSVPDNETFLQYQQAAKRAGALADGLVLDYKYTTAFSNQMFREQMRKSPEYRNWYRTTILKTPAEEFAPFTTKDLAITQWVNDPYSHKPKMMVTAISPVQPISAQYVDDVKLAKKQGSLTQLEKDTLQNYTEVSDTLNSALRAAKGKVADLPTGLAGDTKTLDNLVSKFEFHEDSVVWRGVAGGKYKNKKVGQSWSDHAFASTSYSPESAALFAFEQNGGPTKAGVLLEIHVPKGTRYAPTEVTNPLGDGEVLLERSGKYVVKDSYAIADGRTVVVVDFVPDKTIKHVPAINAKTAQSAPAVPATPPVTPAPVVVPVKPYAIPEQPWTLSPTGDYEPIVVPPWTGKPGFNPNYQHYNDLQIAVDEAVAAGKIPKGVPSNTLKNHYGQEMQKFANWQVHIKVTPTIPEPKLDIPWTPAMSADDAAKWAQDSAVGNQTFWHFTEPEFVDIIKKTGLKSSKAPMGEGVFFTAAPNAPASYYEGKPVIQAAVNIKKPIILDYQKTMAGKYSAELTALSPTYFNVADIQPHLKKNGYDSIIYTHADRDDWIVTFNPEQVVIVNPALPSVTPANPAVIAPAGPTVVPVPASQTIGQVQNAPSGLPATTPVTVLTTPVQPASVQWQTVNGSGFLKTDEWAQAWAKKSNTNDVNAKDFPWAKDSWMKNTHGAGYSYYVQDGGAKFPSMTKRQEQVVKAAQNKQLQFPLVDVTLENAEFVPTQYGGLAAVVEGYIKKMPTDKFPRAYLWKGQYHLTNGHHRVMAAYIRGDATLPVHVIDLDQLAVNDMFPGNLQDLIDGLNPPIASVPSIHLTDAQKAKFGKAPTPAQSSITAPPVGTGLTPASFGNFSAPVGGFVIPPQTQAQIDKMNAALNKHPVFKSADDIKKAAKKASNDKFYAKKKVETAIDQAKAGKNVQLETDLTTLYDEIVAGAVVTDAKAVMKLIDDVKTKVLTPPVAVVTPPAVTPMQAQAAAYYAKVAPTPAPITTVPTPAVDTVEDTLEKIFANSTLVALDIKAEIPEIVLQPWVVKKYNELIDAYNSQGAQLIPLGVTTHLTAVLDGTVIPAQAAMMLPKFVDQFTTTYGKSIEDALGYAIPKTPLLPVAATSPVPVASAKLSTPSGADADLIYLQHNTIKGPVKADLFMDVVSTKHATLDKYVNGGLLEDLKNIGTPDAYGATPIMNQFGNWTLGTTNSPVIKLQTATPMISLKHTINMPDVKSLVDSATLAHFPPKVFKYQGNTYIYKGSESVAAAKILDQPEISVEFFDLDAAIAQQVPIAVAAPATQTVDLYTVDQAIEHAMANTANTLDAITELDTLVPTSELTNWGIVMYEELIDAYSTLGHATPSWMLQYPVKLQKGEVNPTNAAIAYYNHGLPDFESTAGFSLVDIMDVSKAEPIMLKNAAVGFVTPAPIVAPALPPNMTTPSGVNAKDIYSQYEGNGISVDAGMWIEHQPLAVFQTAHFSPGGLLEDLTTIGTEVNGTTPIMKEFNNFVMGGATLPITNMPTGTKLMSGELDVYMPDLEAVVNAGVLKGDTKAFKWKGEYYLASSNVDAIAAKILNLPEVPVQLYDLDAAYQAAAAAAGAPVLTQAQIAAAGAKNLQAATFAAEMDYLINKTPGKLIPNLDINNMFGDIDVAKDWGLKKYGAISDAYVKVGQSVPQTITDALYIVSNPAATLDQVTNVLAVYPLAFNAAPMIVAAKIPAVPKVKKVLKATVAPTHTLPKKVGGLSPAETKQVEELNNYLTKLEVLVPGEQAAAYALLDAVKAGTLDLVDAHKQVLAAADLVRKEWSALSGSVYPLLTQGNNSYDVLYQLEANQLLAKLNAQTISIAEARDTIEQMKLFSFQPKPSKTSGALSSAKSGAKKKVKEAYLAESDPERRRVLARLESAIANDQIVVYNTSDIKDVLAALDYNGWPTPLNYGENVFYNAPSLSQVTDPNYLPPATAVEIKALLTKTPDAPISEIIKSTTSMDNIYATLEDWQIKALDNEIEAIKSGNKYVYTQHTSVGTAEWYTLGNSKITADAAKKIPNGEYLHGDVLAIKDGNKVIVLDAFDGESTVASYIAAGKATINIRIIELDEIRKLPDLGTVPEYLIHAEQVTDAYKVSGWNNVEIKETEKWMHKNGSKSNSKDSTIADIAEQDPEFQTALAQAGMTKYEFQRFVDRHITTWNNNSSRGAEMTALHLMVADELQLAPDVFRMTDNFVDQIPAGKRILAKKEGVYRMMVRAMYKNTQNELAAAGITHLSLWRGYGYQDGRTYMPDDFKQYLVGDKFQHANQALPLQSWSTSRSTAQSFAYKPWGYITKARIEAKYVFATGITGVGTGTSETEFVLMAAPGTVEHEVYRRPDGLKRP